MKNTNNTFNLPKGADYLNACKKNQLALITDMLDASNIRLNAELQEVDARINIIYAYYKLNFIAGAL